MTVLWCPCLTCSVSCVNRLDTVFTTGDNFSRGGVSSRGVSHMHVCVDLPRLTQIPPHLGMPSSQQGSEEFLCNSHASPVLSKHCVCPRVYVADPFQWEASSCFCCQLHNSYTWPMNANKQSSGTHRSSDQTRPLALKFVGFPRRRQALKCWKVFRFKFPHKS